MGSKLPRHRKAARIGQRMAFREVRAVSEGLQRRLQTSGCSLPALGLDGTGISLRGGAAGLVGAVALGSGQPIGRAQIAEGDGEALVAGLKPRVPTDGVEVIVPDAPPTDGVVSEVLGLQHEHGRFHLKRRVGRLIPALAAELGDSVQPLLAQVKQIMAERPEDGGKTLFNLALDIKARFDPRKKIQSPFYRLKRFIWRLSEHGSRYRLGLLQPEAPPSRPMRARTVRGFQTFAGVESALRRTGARVA